MASNNTQKLVASFMQFLNDQLSNSEMSDDGKESIEGMIVVVFITYI